MTEEQKGTEMTQQQPAELLGMPADTEMISMEDLMTMADARAGLIDKLTKIALKKLNRRDIVDFQGNPYLPASACHKVARIFGVSWKLEHPHSIPMEDEKGKYTIVTVSGKFTLGKESIDALGRCSSRDKFFAKITEYMDDPDNPGKQIKKASLRPQSDVDQCDIIGKAVSNCEHNGITRLLGLQGLTWDEIEAHSSLRSKDVGKVEFDEGGDRSGRTGKSTVGGKGATDAQRKMVYAKCKQKDLDPDKICQEVAGCKLDDLPFGSVNSVLDRIQKPAK